MRPYRAESAHNLILSGTDAKNKGLSRFTSILERLFRPYYLYGNFLTSHDRNIGHNQRSCNLKTPDKPLKLLRTCYVKVASTNGMNAWRKEFIIGSDNLSSNSALGY